jgi:hypothetical protein
MSGPTGLLDLLLSDEKQQAANISETVRAFAWARVSTDM